MRVQGVAGSGSGSGLAQSISRAAALPGTGARSGVGLSRIGCADGVVRGVVGAGVGEEARRVVRPQRLVERGEQRLGGDDQQPLSGGVRAGGEPGGDRRDRLAGAVVEADLHHYSRAATKASSRRTP